jgi:hypothetical protein
MPNPFDEPEPPSAQATLARLRAELAQRPAPKAALYRVVEVSRDAQGRLVQQGRIWHADLDHARRFGRALAANSVSQRVEVADSNGAVVERLPVPPPGSVAPSGWGGWKDMPLPPAPPRPRRALPPAPVLERPVLVAPASAFGLLEDDPRPRSLPLAPLSSLHDTLPPTPPAPPAPAVAATPQPPAESGVWPAPSTDPLRQAATARALAQGVPSLATRPVVGMPAPSTPLAGPAAPTLPGAATPPTWAVPPHGTVLPAGLPTTVPPARPVPPGSVATAPSVPPRSATATVADAAGPAAYAGHNSRLPGDMAAALDDAQWLAAQTPPSVPAAPATAATPPTDGSTAPPAGAAPAARPAASAGASRLRARLTGQAPGGGPATLG